MTVDAIESELAGLSVKDRRRILEFLLVLEGESPSGHEAAREESRLAESIRDFQEGRTALAEQVHHELRSRIPAE